MRAVLLPRFLQSLTVDRARAIAWPVLIALVALLVFGALDVAAAQPPIEPSPFRW
jgi:hypothetical protein